MILPFFNGIPWPFKKAPLTWVLFLINLSAFILLYGAHDLVQQKIVDVFNDPDYLQTQGRVYAQFVQKNPDSYSNTINRLSVQVLSGTEQKKIRLFGQLAFRDPVFVQVGARMDFSGDQVAIEKWRRSQERIKDLKQVHAGYLLGVSSERPGVWNWISYQFVHGGVLHLAANMWFLLILGAVLEPVLGGAGFLVLYLMSGLWGALSFIALSGLPAVPLVGASGSVSGLLGAFCALRWHTPTRFFFWVLPARGYSGFVYLPAWVALVMGVLSDLAGFLSTLPELGGVAHAAHLGGLTVGVLCGLLLKPLDLSPWEHLPPKAQSLFGGYSPSPPGAQQS